MLPSFANIDDLSALVDGRVGVERATALLAAGSTRIRSFTGRVWVDSDGNMEGVTEFQVDVLRMVCAAYAARVFNNPRGDTQQITGPFTRTVSAWASSGPELSDAEKSDLRQVMGGVPGLTTIAVTRGELETEPVIWWGRDTPRADRHRRDRGSV